MKNILHFLPVFLQGDPVSGDRAFEEMNPQALLVHSGAELFSVFYAVSINSCVQ